MLGLSAFCASSTHTQLLAGYSSSLYRPSRGLAFLCSWVYCGGTVERLAVTCCFITKPVWRRLEAEVCLQRDWIMLEKCPFADLDGECTYSLTLAGCLYTSYRCSTSNPSVKLLNDRPTWVVVLQLNIWMGPVALAVQTARVWWTDIHLFKVGDRLI